MKVALIHDYLYQDGGAEAVLRVFKKIWPEAPIYTLFHNPARVPDFSTADIRTTFLQKMPFGKTRYRWYMPLMPHAMETHDLSEFDLVISNSSAFAKGVITHPHTLHISYCHTPTRYLWSDTHSYVDEMPHSGLIKTVVPFFLTNIRFWDKITADRVDAFVANSETVRRRIHKYYRRESDVIHPPVDIAKFSPADRVENYFLMGGRLVAYKRFDIVIRAFNRLGIPLKIFGEGPEEENLKNVSRRNIEFLGRVSDEDRTELYRHSIAFLNPQLEDFGLTAVEAMASGRPVIAYAAGGALETVVPGMTGAFFHEQTWESLFDCILHFDPSLFNAQTIRSHALQFDEEIFKEKFRASVEEKWDAFSRGALSHRTAVFAGKEQMSVPL